ncbi:hypothetical protein ACLOJK_037644 [Asimina triloba]
MGEDLELGIYILELVELSENFVKKFRAKVNMTNDCGDLAEGYCSWRQISADPGRFFKRGTLVASGVSMVGHYTRVNFYEFTLAKIGTVIL